MFKNNLQRVFFGTIPVLFCCAIGLTLANATVLPQAPVTSSAQTKKLADLMPEGDGKRLVVARCHNCHSLETTINAHHDRKEWDATIQRMVNLGTYLTDDDRKLVLDYLVANYPPKDADSSAPSPATPPSSPK